MSRTTYLLQTSVNISAVSEHWRINFVFFLVRHCYLVTCIAQRHILLPVFLYVFVVNWILLIFVSMCCDIHRCCSNDLRWLTYKIFAFYHVRRRFFTVCSACFWEYWHSASSFVLVFFACVNTVPSCNSFYTICRLAWMFSGVSVMYHVDGFRCSITCRSDEYCSAATSAGCWHLQACFTTTGQ